MEDGAESSYYQNGLVSNTLDIPLKRDGEGEVVTINLSEELPEDPTDLCNLLENEESEKEYWLAIAQAYAQQDKIDEAFEVVKKGLDVTKFSYSEKVAFHAFLSWLYLKLASKGIDKEGNLDNASREIAHVSANDSTNLSNILAQGVLLLNTPNSKDGKDSKTSKDDEAQDIFDRLLKVNSSNCIALFGKAKIYMNRKNYHQALKVYQQILILNPTIKPDPRLGIGICFWKLEDFKTALLSWERVLALNPDNINARILINLAKFNETLTNSFTDEEFSSNYQICLEKLKENYKEAPSNNIILLQLASVFFSKENYDKVEKICNQIIKSIDVTDSKLLSRIQSNVLSQANFWIGRVYNAREDYIESQKYFREANRLNQDSVLPQLGLGQIQLLRNSTEAGIMALEAILKANPRCIEANYALGILFSQVPKKVNQGIRYLEKYLNYCNNPSRALTNDIEERAIIKEPVILNSYLSLSKAYEAIDTSKSLDYLTKAIELLDSTNSDIPLEIYNNVGVLHFLKNNLQSATSFFKTAVSKLEEQKEDKDGDLIFTDDPSSQKNQLAITLNYNLARSQEVTNEDESIQLYEKILSKCPNYFTAKLRLLFLNCISQTRPVDESVREEIDKVLSEHTDNLEVRAFYGWFIKKYQKRLHLKPDLQSNHHKETLVKFDSHDCYALISLANVYSTIARDAKPANAKDEERKNQYYIRAAQLYQKVLGVDPKNVYAAQGIAIILIETKETITGLEIFRKVRDSLNDISIYLNLGHVLLDLKQFSKAIENYEIALIRYTNGKDSRVLSLLGRAWYIRGAYEKNLAFFNRALEYSEKALETNKIPALKFNLAYIQFQIAEFIRKLPVDKRTIEDIEAAIVGLNDAIITLNKLAEEKFPPYPAEDLKSRAAMCSDTLLKQLDKCLDETKEYNIKFEKKLTEAKKAREEEKLKIQKEEEERFKKQKAIQDELAKERMKLQEQALQWAEENASRIIDEDDDRLFEEEVSKEKASEKEPKKGKKGGKRTKKKKIVDSDEEESDNESEQESKRKNPEPADIDSKRRKVSSLSNERIVDSDEDLDDIDNESITDGAESEQEPATKSEKATEVTEGEGEDEEDDLF